MSVGGTQRHRGLGRCPSGNTNEQQRDGGQDPPGGLEEDGEQPAVLLGVRPGVEVLPRDCRVTT